MSVRTGFTALLTILGCISVSPELMAEAPEDIYFETRNSFIQQFEKGTNTVDNDTALADLETKLKAIVGSISIEGFPKNGKINLLTLQNQYLDFGQADGLRFESQQESLFITTEKILKLFLSEKSDLPEDLNSLSKTMSLYRYVFSIDAQVAFFAEIPVQSANNKSFTYSFLGITAQDIALTPSEIFVFVSNGDLILLVHSPANVEISEIPQCRIELDNYINNGSETYFDLYHQCYGREAKNQQFFTLIKKQAQSIVDRLLKK